MVRKIVLSLIAILGLCAFVFAQNKQVSGVISGSDGAPIAGATIMVAGTHVGTTSNADGSFTIAAPMDGSLDVSFIGYETQKVAISGKTRMNILLKEDAIGVDEVVVTAMGITRSEKSLGYSVSTVKSDDISKAREGNVLNSLAGKVAGVNISSGSGTAGGGSRIIIRGQSSLGSAGSPLFVIDGMPVSNQSYNPTGLDGSVDVGNRMGDISGDDIESINVLKGAAATALYGARAKDGAIIITTKKGSRTQKTAVSINSSIRFDNVLRLPDYQNSYAQGSGTTGEYDVDNMNGWGPKIEGQTVKNFKGDEVALKAYKNNVRDFFKTGHTYINSISVSGGDEKNDFRLGFTAHNQDGIIETNTYDKYNVSFNGGRKFSDKVSARISMTYARTSSEGRPAQGSNDVNVLMPSVLTIPRTLDIDMLKHNWKTETGEQGTMDSKGKVGNFYWNMNENLFTNTVDRMYGSAIVTYTPVKGLTITNNLGTDIFGENRRQIYALGTIGSEGGFNTYDINYRSINNDLIASYNLDFGKNKDWNFKAMLGHNINQVETRSLEVEANQLLVADVYSYSNAKSVSTTNNKTKRRLIGIYGELDLSWRDMLFLSVTGRNDWSSTMPKSHQSYFYPSVSLGFIFTELMPKNNILSYGKLRASYANVGSDTSPYQLDFMYYPSDSYFLQFIGSNKIPHGGLLAYFASQVYPDPNLEPQNQSSFEIGTDLRFFDGRIRLDATYYYQKTTKNIVSLDVANSTGYFNMRKNAGTISNQGLEILLGVTPVRTKSFRWDMDINFATNRQRVDELDPSIDSYDLASGYNSCQIKAKKDESFSMYGTYWLRDDDGNYIINEKTGLRTISKDTKNLGKVAPDWTMGIGNTFTYKSLSLSFLLDFRVGGVMYSGSVSNLRTAGVAEETAAKGRDKFIDKGVIRTETGYRENDVEVSPYNFWTNNYNTKVTEANVFDATLIKLREITLNYAFPKKWFTNTSIGQLAIGFEARNLWLIKSNVPHIDPESSIFGPSSIGSGVEYAAIPSTRSFGFNIKLTF